MNTAFEFEQLEPVIAPDWCTDESFWGFAKRFAVTVIPIGGPVLAGAYCWWMA
jgi:hypothetical protein